MATFLAVGFPILSLLVLPGGVDPRIIVLAVRSRLPARSCLRVVDPGPTYARRFREALFLVYALELMWLILPEELMRVVPVSGRVIGPLCGRGAGWPTRQIP